MAGALVAAGGGGYSPPAPNAAPLPNSPGSAPAGVSWTAPGVNQASNSFTSGLANIANVANLGANYQNAFAANSGATAGTIAGLNAQNALDLQNANLGNQQYSNQQTALNQAYQNAAQGNSLDIYNNKVNYDGTFRDSDYYNNTLTNQTGRFTDQSAYLNSLYGFNDQTLSNETLRANQDSALNNQLQGIQGQGALITQQAADRNARYATEASGAGATARAYGENLGTDASTYQNALAGFANTNAQSQNLDQYRINSANTSHGQTAAGIGDQISSANHTQWQNGLDNAEQQGKISDSQKQLFANSLQLGLNGQQLANALNTNLTSLNLSHQSSLAGTYADLLKNNGQIGQINQQNGAQAIASAAAKVKPPPKKIK